jgi:hypothetical protein
MHLAKTLPQAERLSAERDQPFGRAPSGSFYVGRADELKRLGAEPRFPRVSPERARVIWATRGPAGCFHVTAIEDGYIRQVWESLPDNYSWADALLHIAQGKAES